MNVWSCNKFQYRSINPSLFTIHFLRTGKKWNMFGKKMTNKLNLTQRAKKARINIFASNNSRNNKKKTRQPIGVWRSCRFNRKLNFPFNLKSVTNIAAVYTKYSFGLSSYTYDSTNKMKIKLLETMMMMMMRKKRQKMRRDRQGKHQRKNRLVVMVLPYEIYFTLHSSSLYIILCNIFAAFSLLSPIYS